VKAIIYEKFGAPEVLKIEEMEIPKPKANEVLIKVYAASINSGDIHMRSGDPFIARLFAGPIKVRSSFVTFDTSKRIFLPLDFGRSIL